MCLCEILLIICRIIPRRHIPPNHTEFCETPGLYVRIVAHRVNVCQFFTTLEQFRQIKRNKISGVFLPMHLHPIYTPLH
jgi:hypothetical protein